MKPLRSEPSLSRNAAFNVGGLLIYLTIAFFLSPFVIHHLGNARYGAWSLAADLMGYYTLLDFGIRWAVGFFVARYSARGERDRLESCISSGFWGSAAIGVVLALLGVGLSFAFPHIFTKGELSAREVVPALCVFSATIGLGLPMEVFSFVLSGSRRQDLINVTEVTTRLLMAAGMYAVLKSGGGLLSVSLVQCGGRILCWSWNYVWAQRVAGPFSLRPSGFRFADLRALAGLGSVNIVIAFAELVISRTDLIVIGAFLGVKWVAFYNIGRLLVDYGSQLNGNITQSFTPHFMHLIAREDLAAVRRLYLLGARISGLLSIPLAACMFAFGRCFLRLWVGPPYVTGALGERSDVVMAVLLLALLPRWQQGISWQVMLASGKYRVLMFQNLAVAATNILLSVTLVRHYGMIGVASARAITSIITNLTWTPALVLHRFQVPWRDYLREGLARPLLLGLIMAGFSTAIVRICLPVSWKLLFAEAALTLLVYTALCWAIGFNRDDRRLARQRLDSLLHRFRPPAPGSDATGA